jgi:hypothetical protein
MSDALLTTADRQEALSRADVSAIAASAGYVTSRPDLDRDSVDIVFGAGGSMRPSLHVQLKATMNSRRAELAENRERLAQRIGSPVDPPTVRILGVTSRQAGAPRRSEIGDHRNSVRERI